MRFLALVWYEERVTIRNRTTEDQRVITLQCLHVPGDQDVRAAIDRLGWNEYEIVAVDGVEVKS